MSRMTGRECDPFFSFSRFSSGDDGHDDHDDDDEWLSNVKTMRIIVAECEADYTGRLLAHLPDAWRVILVKKDGSVLIFSELGSYKPLNWMVAPCTVREITPKDSQFARLARPRTDDSDVTGSEEARSQTGENVLVGPNQLPERIMRVRAEKSSDLLTIRLYRVRSDETYDLGADPGLVKDGVEDHLQHLLAEQIERIGQGATLVRREYPTPVGPVDIMAKDKNGENVAIEIKRHGGIDGVEQLTRYVTFLNKNPLLRPVHGIFAAETITEQAQTLAKSRGFRCLILDYHDMKKEGETDLTLF
jgi:RecB family endonuclease NucS